MVRNVAAVLLIILLLFTCTSAEIMRIMPGSNSISSTQIHDATMGAENSVIFATDNGLSIYFCDSGSWTIMHPDYSNPKASVYDNFILSVEPDRDGNGWFGYPGALQIYDGESFTTIDKPPILYKNSVNDLQLRGNEMWVAVGKAGLIRFENNSYEWFQPFRESGLEAYKITSMAVDPSDNRLVAVSYNYGAWALDWSTGTYSFKHIPVPENEKSLKGVKSNPFGGIYIFSNKNIYGYRDGQISQVLSADAIDKWNVTQINDVTVSREGVMIVATDDGIAGYSGSEMVLRLKNRDGLGGYFVSFLFTDADGRIWYSVRDNVGFIYPLSDHLRKEITPPTMTAAQPEIPATAVATPITTIPTVITETAATVPSTGTEEDEGIFSAIARFFSSIWDVLMTPPQEMI